MKNKILVLLAILTSCANAYATDLNYTTTIYTFATNDFSPAYVIQLPFNIDSNCDVGSTASRAYIKKENKGLYAAALTAAAQGLSVGVGIKTDSDSVVIPNTLPSPLTCEVTQIIVLG